MIRYIIKLAEAEMQDLSTIINKGVHSTQAFRNAYILLNCDEGPYCKYPFSQTDLGQIFFSL